MFMIKQCLIVNVFIRQHCVSAIHLQIMEGLLHLFAKKLQKGNNMYILNHYTAGLILFGERSQLSRQSLRKVS